MRSLMRLLVVLTAGLLVGCSGGNGSTDGASSAEEYFIQLESISQETSDAFDELGREIDSALEGAESEEQVLQVLRPGLEDGATLSRGALEELEGLSPPDDVADAHAAFVESTRQGTDVLVGLVEDYDQLTLDDVFATLQGEEFAAAEQAQDRACADLQTIADERDIDVDLACDDGAEPTTAAEPSAEPTASAGVQRYEDTEAGFAVDYPDTWGLDENPRGAVVQFFALETAEDAIPANLNVVVEDLPLDLTARQYLDVGWEKLKPQLSEVEEIDSADLTVGGLPAASMEYRAQFPGMASVGHFFQVAVLDERRAFVFSYVGTDENFETYRPDAQAIIESFAVA